MKKRWIGLYLMYALLLPLLCACGEKEIKDEAGNAIFYLSSDKTCVLSEDYEMKADTQEKQIEELLIRLQKESSKADLLQAIPENISVRNTMVNGYLLTIDFSEEYLSLGAREEVLTRAAVVKTLMQVDGISYVSFTVEGEPLVSENGVLVGSMNDESFVENPGQQIVGSQETVLTLFFSNADGTKLREESRKVRFSSNVSMEKLVLEQLIEGPESADARATLPSDAKVITVSVNEGVCYVNLDEAIVNQNTDVVEDVILYSIVNSLTQLKEVEKVQISINGDTQRKLRFVYDLAVMYEQEPSWLEEEPQREINSEVEDKK